MIIHGANPSPFVRKTIAVFEEKGLDYELEPLAPLPKTPELLAMNPLGKIPILEHDGAFIPDSSVICAYVEKLYPSPSVHPKDPADYAQALFLEEYSDTVLSTAIGDVLFNRFIKPTFFQQEPDEEVVQKALTETLPPMLAYLETRVPGAGCLFGEFSIADAALAGSFGSLKKCGVELDAGRYPKLAAYAAALLERPSVKVGLTF